MPARRAVRLAAVVLTGGVAASALGGCSIDAGALQQRTHSYSVSGGLQALVVHAHVGGVHITGADSGQVTVTELLTFRHTAPRTTHQVTAGTLTMDNHCPALETCSVGYDITAPRTMTIRVDDSVGTIRLKSLSGQVTAHTNAGNIDLGQVSGPVEVTTHAGSILGQDVSSANITLRLSAGRIEVTFSAPPETVTATATAGSVSLRLPGNVAYAVDARATVGATHVSVTRNPASPRHITATATTGSITIEPAP